MHVACPHCQAGYDFPVELITGPDFPARCALCLQGFEIGREGVRTPSAPETKGLGFEGSSTTAARPLARLRPSTASPPRAQAEPTPADTLPESAAPASEREVDGDAQRPGQGGTREDGEGGRVGDRERGDRSAGPDGEPARGRGGDSGAGGFYMVLRGGAVHDPTPRRRVAVVPRKSDRAPPQARLVSVNANFGRVAQARGRPATAEMPLETPVASEAPEPIRAVPVRPRWPWVAGAGFLMVVTGAATAWILSVPEPDSSAAELAPVAAPSEPPPSAAPVSGETQLVATVTALEPMPDQRAVLLHGHVFNGTADAHTAIRLRAELLVDGVIERRREVWCCEDLSAEEGAKRLADPKGLRVSAIPEPGRVTTIEPNSDEPFSVVFPSIDEATLRRGMTGEVRMTEALRLQTD